MTKALRRIKRISGMVLAILVFAGAFFENGNLATAEASSFLDELGLFAPKPKLTHISMATARALALEESTAYFQVETEIETKKANLDSAQKAIRLKQKSMSTFRWSPLLNFKLPTKPNEAQAFEFQFKPISIQSEIDKATHKLTDTKLGIYEEINNLYLNIVLTQKKIAFEEKRVAAYEDGLARNQARLLTGDATQADVDAVSKKLEASKNNLSTNKRSFTADLEKLSKKLGADLSSACRFDMPFIEASIPRSVLEAFIQYTLDHDQTYYEACLDDTSARVSVVTNLSLMSRQYGGDINRISNYVTLALGGLEIKGSLQKAFKNDYKAFLEKIDSYWAGKKRILFIKIPKLWFKGSLDGTRFVDDDPNVLYEDVLNYSSTHVTKQKTEEELIQQVKDSFENYISIRNSYLTAIKDLDKAEADLDADFIRNQIGEVSFEEFDSEASDFEEMQNNFFETAKTYSETLYSFDRLTCGAVSAYLAGTDPSLAAGETGTSHVEKETDKDARYFIKQIVQSEAFEVNIYVPEHMNVDVTDFELWCDGMIVGKRTPADQYLKHLALTKNVVNDVKIRLYNGDEFIDDVKIDPSVSEGPLPIVLGRNIVKADETEIGYYETDINDVTGIISIRVEVTEDPEVAYYRVETIDEKVMSGKEPVENKKEFKHLAIVENGLDDVVIVLLDSDKNELYRARFVSATRKIKKKTD